MLRDFPDAHLGRRGPDEAGRGRLKMGARLPVESIMGAHREGGQCDMKNKLE